MLRHDHGSESPVYRSGVQLRNNENRRRISRPATEIARRELSNQVSDQCPAEVLPAAKRDSCRSFVRHERSKAPRCLRTRTFTKLAEPNLYDLGAIFTLTFRVASIFDERSGGKRIKKTRRCAVDRRGSVCMQLTDARFPIFVFNGSVKDSRATNQCGN